MRTRTPWPPVSAPAPFGVPPFPPLRVRGGGAYRLRRMVRGKRRAMAAGLAMTAAALAASGLGGEEGKVAPPGPPPEPGRQSVRLVSAPVRITDAATVRLLRPGDRVDVIASEEAGGDARVVARDVRVTKVPRAAAEDADLLATGGGTGTGPGDGALVMLSVRRETAVALAGASASGYLAVAVSHAY
ncbi:RcpC/CpaB family pilus assembly protein [Streptomyces sp. NBC_01433]|uniref:RcpC/CpaB family pilus assembly protein n=1 Tax=Streptomyces sp. NBC_01433 TaxID=2903864 RepID=UPI00225832C7|nr:RcpC/CpaB family pilus assembly protein [Streptomyces sp. NBC_01433]MCX4676512.1 RcpC/CpaB family pilus assembly protein [Streptomyces sp. NBC_01433]